MTYHQIIDQLSQEIDYSLHSYSAYDFASALAHDLQFYGFSKAGSIGILSDFCSVSKDDILEIVSRVF